ncbi:hypothetical protein Anapl_04857 [Anas platyrhynchos]|uniref:Uncharacterized protein n=1 Tax=Anas platyrhynchos TaxID=8839 RepID=R0M2B6_ANAPL|nr:hypothetical protein Anapl_04857 [Anas platyrhynchos]
MAGGSPSPASPAGTPSTQKPTAIAMGTAPALQAEPGLSPQPSKGRSLKHTSTNTSSVLRPASTCTAVQSSAITINTHNEKQEYSKPKGITYPNANPFKHPFCNQTLEQLGQPSSSSQRDLRAAGTPSDEIRRMMQVSLTAEERQLCQQVMVQLGGRQNYNPSGNSIRTATVFMRTNISMQEPYHFLISLN